MKRPLKQAMHYLEVISDQNSNEIGEGDFQAKVKPVRCYFQVLKNSLNNFQDISSIAAGEFRIIEQKCDFYRFLREILELMSFRFSVRRGISYVVLVDSKLQQEILIDKTRLKQILLNLLEKASRFNENCSIFLIIEKIGLKEGVENCI